MFKGKKTFIVSLLIVAGIGLVIRFPCIVRYSFFDVMVDLVPDQARDSMVCMEMKESLLDKISGKDRPLSEGFYLGPQTAKREYRILPLYRYLILPFAFLSANPIFHVLPNMILSILTIILLGIFLYVLMERVTEQKRILLAIIGSFWLAVSYSDIFLSTLVWNPSPIPFFLISAMLLFREQLRGVKLAWLEIVSWVALGSLLAFLISLHSTTMFVTPILFAFGCLVFIIKSRKFPKKWFLPLIAIIVIVFWLLPYIIKETALGWKNTNNILQTILSSKDLASGVSFGNRIVKVFNSYASLGYQTFFIGVNGVFKIFSAIFISIAMVTCLVRFRGDKALLIMILLLLIVFFGAVSSYPKETLLHHKLLILLLPTIFCVVSLAYLDHRKIFQAIFFYLIAGGLIVSIFTNIYFDSINLINRYGKNRTINTWDMVELARIVPKDAKVTFADYSSYQRKKAYPFKYIDKYITKKNLSFLEVEQAPKGTYVIYPKRKLKFLDYSRKGLLYAVVDNPGKINRKMSLIAETPVAYVYKIKD